MQRPLQQRPRGPASSWILTDGHAGNLRQARALAIALGRDAREWTLKPRPPWQWLAPRRLPGSTAAFGPEFNDALQSPPSLAIGCGRQAALATRLLRSRDTRTVQILDPRLAPRHWDVVVVPEHDRLRGDNVIPLQGSLNPVDDLWLAAARAAFPELGQLPRPHTALLLGGPSAHTRFDPDRVERCLQQLRDMLSAQGGSVLATPSRRTPQAVIERMRTLLGPLPSLIWSGPGDGPNPYAGVLGWADRIVCSADSVNMLSEAAATNAPLYALGVEQLSGRPRRFVETLQDSGRLRRFDDELAPYPVSPLRETTRVAAEVATRLKLG